MNDERHIDMLHFWDWVYQDYNLVTVEEIQKQQLLLSSIDTALRALRLSYGFVNTILVLILVKPFHEPLKSFVKKTKSFFLILLSRR